MTILSISNLNAHLANNTYRAIIKNRELLWQLFCSIDEQQFTYFNVQIIDFNTRVIYGDLDVICQFKRFIVQIQDIFIMALKKECQTTFTTVTLNNDFYLSSDNIQSNLIDCERYHTPLVMDCLFPRFFEMAKELNIHINRKIQYSLVQNGNFQLGADKASYTVTVPDHYKKNTFAFDFYILFVKQELCDLTFELPQGSIRAHRAVLALYAGPFFKAELIKNPEKIVLKSVSLYTFKAFLTYVYLGTKSFEIFSADKILDFKELYMWAEFTEVESLFNFAINALKQKTST